MEIKVIGVLGAGSMGNGIAQVAAQAGYQVIMRDIEDRFVQNGLKAIEKFLAKSVEKGKTTEDQKKGILARIKGTTHMEDLKEVDYVIEAVLEVFGKRDTLLPLKIVEASPQLRRFTARLAEAGS